MQFNFSRLSTHTAPHLPLPTSLLPDLEQHTATKAMEGSIYKMFYEVKIWFFGLIRFLSTAVFYSKKMKNLKSNLKEEEEGEGRKTNHSC